MDRVSDKKLKEMIRLFSLAHADEVVVALTELRERRNAKQHVVKFQWKCRCGFLNKWSWPKVEYDDWVVTFMECDKCGEVTTMRTRPERVTYDLPSKNNTRRTSG